MNEPEKRDKQVNEIEEREGWLEEDEVVELEVSRPLDKIIPVRLPSDAWKALRGEATKLGGGPSTLALMWIMERLRGSGLEKSS